MDGDKMMFRFVLVPVRDKCVGGAVCAEQITLGGRQQSKHCKGGFSVW